MARSVVQNYVHRPAYSPQVFALLAGLLPADTVAVLDVGCGPGKLAIGLAQSAARVDAVDPSAEMIALGRASPGGNDPKICWIEGKLEEARLAPPYGLVVCGASFHWLDTDVALTCFAQALASDGVLALVDGDAAVDPPWRDAELEMMSDFIERLQGERPKFAATSREALARPQLAHPRFERRGFQITAPHPVRQSIADYVACQHSRATWSIDFMGPEMTDEFDTRLHALLAPHARDGMLDFVVQSRVEWGRPLLYPPLE